MRAIAININIYRLTHTHTVYKKLLITTLQYYTYTYFDFFPRSTDDRTQNMIPIKWFDLLFKIWLYRHWLQLLLLLLLTDDSFDLFVSSFLTLSLILCSRSSSSLSLSLSFVRSFWFSALFHRFYVFFLSISLSISFFCVPSRHNNKLIYWHQQQFCLSGNLEWWCTF